MVGVERPRRGRLTNRWSRNLYKNVSYVTLKTAASDQLPVLSVRTDPEKGGADAFESRSPAAPHHDDGMKCTVPTS